MRHERVNRRTLAACLAALLSAGCYSTSPLDATPQVDLDAKLLGRWNCISADSNGPEVAVATFTTAPDAKREYRLTWREREDKTETYRAFLSSVRGSTFLNIGEQNEHPSWAFVRYTLLRDDVLYVEVANHELFKDEGSDATPAAARATLEKALKSRPDAVGTFCACVRPAPEEP